MNASVGTPRNSLEPGTASASKHQQSVKLPNWKKVENLKKFGLQTLEEDFELQN